MTRLRPITSLVSAILLVGAAAPLAAAAEVVEIGFEPAQGFTVGAPVPRGPVPISIFAPDAFTVADDGGEAALVSPPAGEDTPTRHQVATFDLRPFVAAADPLDTLTARFNLRLAGEPDGGAVRLHRLRVDKLVEVDVHSDGTLVWQRGGHGVTLVDAHSAPLTVNADAPVELMLAVDVQTGHATVYVNGVQQGEPVALPDDGDRPAPQGVQWVCFVNPTDAGYRQLRLEHLSIATNTPPAAPDAVAEPLARAAPAPRTAPAVVHEPLPVVDGRYPVGTELRREPGPTVLEADGPRSPRGFWGGIGLGRGEWWFSTDEQGAVVARMTSVDGPTRMQYGTALTTPLLEAAWGQVVEVSVEVSGRVDRLGPQGQGPVLVVELNGPGGAGTQLSTGPTAALRGGRVRVEPYEGTLEWTTLRSVFRLPYRTEKLAALMYLMNSEGELSWRNPMIRVVADDTPTTDTLPEAFPSLEAARAAVAARMRPAYDQLMAELIERLAPPDTIVTIPDDLADRRPRLFVHAGLTLDDLRTRWADPRFAETVETARRQAAALVELLPTLPATQNLNVEDPLRGFADGLALLVVVATLSDDPAERQRCLDAVAGWTDRLMGWGVSPKNLPLAQTQFAFALAYDWLYAELDAEHRARMRAYLLAMAAESFDFGNAEVNWIFGRQYVANHLWFNYMGRSATALALWAEPDTDPALLRHYLEDAALQFWIVAHTQSPGGMPLEGFLYQDYGLRPLVDYLAFTEHALDWRVDLIDEPAHRNLGVRLHALLPGARGFMVSSDGNKEQYSGYPFFYWVASRFGEPLSQTLADLMLDKARAQDKPDEFVRALQRSNRFTRVNGWRTLLYRDPDVPTVDKPSLPLHFTDTNLGLATARSGWHDDAAFFGLRCGPLSGVATSEAFGPLLYVAVSGHCYPEQGNVMLQIGDADYLPNVEYSRTKLTSNHNLIVFEGRGEQQGRWVGQVGEGGAWLQGRQYLTFEREARILEERHEADRHYYRCDLGGLYRLSEGSAAGAATFPEYVREVTFLPRDGVVVIVDHVQLDQPRGFRLNLLTGGVAATLSDGRAELTLKQGPAAQVLVAADVPVAVEAHPGEVLSWGRNDRLIVSATAEPATRGTIAAVIGPAEVVRGLRLEERDGAWWLRRPAGEDFVVGHRAER
jgi:hypothetical protein